MIHASPTPIDEVERGRTDFSVASTLCADAGFTTLDSNTHFVRAITQSTGRIHAEGRLVRERGGAVTTEARVYDDAGTLSAHAKSAALIVRSER